MIDSSHKRLKDLRSARALVRNAESLYASGAYAQVYAAMDADEESLLRAIDAAKMEFPSRLAMRYDFYAPSGSVRMVISPPDAYDEMPFITTSTWNALKVILHSGDVRVDAPFDVAVKDSGVIHRIIRGRNSA